MAKFYEDVNCISAWLFDDGEGAGDTALDYTPRDNDLADTGTVGRAAAKFGNGAIFDGAADKRLTIAFADQTDLKLSLFDNFTINLWAYYDAASVPKFTFPFLLTGCALYGDTRTWQILCDSDKLTFYWSTDGSSWSNSLVSDANMPLQEWVHIAIRCTNGLYEMFINGELQADTESDSNIADGDNDLVIGAEATGNVICRWDGPIEDVGIFERALSDNEILNIMNLGLAGGLPPLAGAVITNRHAFYPKGPTLTDLSIRKNIEHRQITDPNLSSSHLMNPVLSHRSLLNEVIDNG